MQYLGRFELAPHFSREDFVHWFTPRPNIIESFVVETGGQITDFVSYYTLPSSVMHHPVHKNLKVGLRPPYRMV